MQWFCLLSYAFESLSLRLPGAILSQINFVAMMILNGRIYLPDVVFFVLFSQQHSIPLWHSEELQLLLVVPPLKCTEVLSILKPEKTGLVEVKDLAVLNGVECLRLLSIWLWSNGNGSRAGLRKGIFRQTRRRFENYAKAGERGWKEEVCFLIQTVFVNKKKPRVKIETYNTHILRRVWGTPIQRQKTS